MLKKISKKIVLLGLTALVGCSSFGLTMAYMTDGEDATNVVTLGNVSINLTETDWKPENGKNILPRGTAAKNPEVTNTGSLDTWVFLEVTSPKKNIVTVDNSTKKKNAAANVEIFSFKANSDWELVNKTEDNNNVYYTYGYKKILKTGAKTQSLFDSVSVVNYLEGSLDKNETLSLDVKAEAIQWNAEKEDAGLKKIYQDYLNEGSNS